MTSRPLARPFALAGLAAAVGLSLGVIGHAATSEPVKARQHLMKMQAEQLKVLVPMAQGKMDYDAAKAKAAAAELVKLTSEPVKPLFPEGTAMGQSPDKTKAEPAIWKNWSDFQSKHDALHDAALSLDKVAGDGLDALRGGIGQVGKACGACHKSYRASMN